MAVTDRILRRPKPRRPIGGPDSIKKPRPRNPKPIGMPGKPGKPAPKGGKNPKLPYRFPDGPKPFPKKPAPGTRPGVPRKPGKSDPRLPYRRPDSKPLPKKDGVRKPAPKGGNIRDLLYRAKPGEKLQKGFAGRSLNKEQMRKDTSPRKLPTQVKIDKVKMAEESYKNYLKQRGEKIRKADGSVLKGLEKLKKAPRPTMNKDFRYLNMMGPAGPAPKRSPRGPVDYMSMFKSGPARKTKPVTPRRGGR